MNKKELKEKVQSLLNGNIEYFDSLYVKVDWEKSTKDTTIVEIIPQSEYEKMMGQRKENDSQ